MEFIPSSMPGESPAEFPCEESTPESTKGRTLTHGSLKLGMWRIAWPLLLTTLCISLTDFVHVQVAGYLSPAAQAAVGICDQITMICIILIDSIAIGTTAMVSRSYGCGQSSETQTTAAQSLWLAAVMGGSLAAIVSLVAHIFLPMCTVCPTTAAINTEGQMYISIAALYLIPFSFVSSITAVFRGIGNSRVQLQTIALLTVLDIVGNYLLVVVGWPVKNLGITGIAYASLVASTVATLYAIGRMGWSPLRSTFSKLSPLPTKVTRQILAIGLPSSLQEIAWATSALVLFWILSMCPKPTDALAAWAIGPRIEAFVYLPLTALAIAVMVAVGQNLGANRIARAWTASRNVALIGVAGMVVAATILFIFADALGRATTEDATAAVLIASYLRFNVIAEPFVALENILGGSLQALDDNKYPLVVGFLCNWMIRLPLAYGLAIPAGYGPTGVWIAMMTTDIISGLLITLRFSTRPLWKSIKSALSPEPLAGDSKIISVERPALSNPCIEIEKPSDTNRPHESV